jgi:hypothetical protein
VTEFDRPDTRLSPTAFVATTVKVYESPSVSPLTAAEVSDPDTVML